MAIHFHDPHRMCHDGQRAVRVVKPHTGAEIYRLDQPPGRHSSLGMLTPVEYEVLQINPSAAA